MLGELNASHLGFTPLRKGDKSPDDWREITPVAGAEVLDDEVELALRELVEPWLTASNGRAESICVVGGIEHNAGMLLDKP